VYRCHKKGHYANKCPEAKAKDVKGSIKMRKVEDSSAKSDAEMKSLRQLRIRHQIRCSDIEDQRPSIHV